MTIPEFFAAHPDCAVAFSGGIDSAWLLHEALRCGRKVRAYFVRTPFQPAFELKDAQETAAALGAALTVLEVDVLTVPQVAANPENRCYYCKCALFTALLAQAKADGFPLVLDGSNASDDAGDRPGMRALRELGVRSPLRECGVTKADIRAQAKAAGIALWDKPSYACLATRIPAGTHITREDLRRVEEGEALLMDLGYTDFRLRLRGDHALLQVREADLDRATAELPMLQQKLRHILPQVVLDSVPRQSRES